MEKRGRHDLERLSQHLSIKIVEAADVCLRFSGRNRHSFNRMFLVYRADSNENFIYNHTTNQRLTMRTGNIYFMPCNTDLAFNFQYDMRFLSFHFFLEVYERFDIFSMQEQCHVDVDRSDVISELVSILRSEFNIRSQCRLNGLIMAQAALFMEMENSLTSRIQFLNSKYAVLFEFIKSSACSSTTIDELANVADMSRDTLSREFSRDCGITLKKYLTQAIIRKAERFLLEPKATARGVSEALDFNNEYYFAKFFKKNTGRTPGEFKRDNSTLTNYIHAFSVSSP